MDPKRSRELRFAVTRPGIRLDKYIVEEFPQLSRSHVKRLISEGYITVNGRSAKGSLKLKPGDEVAAMIPPPLSLIHI